MHANLPHESLSCDVCVIGGGSAGLSAAAGAAQLGAKVVLIERGAMGGDCLHTGCVPSKSLIAAAHAAHMFTSAMAFGVGEAIAPRIDFEAIHHHIHRVIGAIAPHDSVERFEGLGIKVIKETARFTSPTELVASGHRITARRFVIATGSRAVVPPVPGLRELEPLTNETIFDLTERPDHLLVMGGGPIGLEMAQAFRRLGSDVTLVDVAGILPRDEPEAAALIRGVLRDDGIVLHEHAKLIDPRKGEKGVSATIETATDRYEITASHVLVAAGRKANVEDLGLELAGVKFGPKGIEVDGRLRTSNPRIFALGDVAGGPQFTHIAGYHAGIFIRNAMFGLPAKVDYSALPWVTYLDPEVAHVGLTEAEARKAHGEVVVVVEHMDENDRAQAERRTEGFIKLIMTSKGKVLGVTIVAPHAGEMISLWGLVISGKVKLSAVATMIAPYPTLAEISKRAASTYFKPKLFGRLPKAWVGLVQKILP
ncbi:MULTISPECIES: dihydrolipoyl dehydrogenase family protein [Devosia]|uniref:dihydrolipoyl dehydrogenase family protein n=1 Tax=Devosia TaxID=46913 RepID=UPI000CE95925|nr:MULTISPECIES: FAD-dependent oxidoreductase [Devosia]AVF05907.1 dihydrolipoamide dehydrogenase [Devosia sp. I507]